MARRIQESPHDHKGIDGPHDAVQFHPGRGIGGEGLIKLLCPRIFAVEGFNLLEIVAHGECFVP